MKKIALLGTFIRDRIVPLTGPEVQCLGGLYHSVAFTSLLGDADFRIMPFARVGQDFFEIVQETLRPFANIDLSHLIIDSQKNTAVKLIYKTPTSRDEVTSALMAPLQPHELQACTQADGIVVNLITGGDVSLESVQWLSQNCDAPIYLDFHSLALGFDESGMRYYRRPSGWQDWLRAVDFVQMNEGEAACLSGTNNFEDWLHFLHTCLDEFNLSGMHVTVGEHGVLSGTRGMDGRHLVKHVPGLSNGIVVRDIIGCGDAFGASFLVHYLTNNDYWAAVAFANQIAAHNTTFMGSITREIYSEHIQPYATFEK